jgi:hexaprenyl-diphosphate synthase
MKQRLVLTLLRNVSSTTRLANTAIPSTTIDTLALTTRIREMVVSNHAPLTAVNQYYLNGGKMLRPSIVLQLSRSLELYSGKAIPQLNEFGVLPTQQRLAEIVELIHAASLLHDDVVDDATERRERPTANVAFGSKSAVLSGDYLLAQASVALSELGSLPVISLLATVIQDLVEGELMQMNAPLADQLNMQFYLQKSYLKTASLIAKSCRATAVLGGHPIDIQDACYQFGRHLGLAFQIIDDKLDYTASRDELGKPVGADLRNGIITAPVLFATEECPQIRDFIARDFSHDGDHDTVIKMVLASCGIQKTQELAEQLLDRSLSALAFLPPSLVSDSFADLIASVTLRRK